MVLARKFNIHLTKLFKGQLERMSERQLSLKRAEKVPEMMKDTSLWFQEA